MRRKSIIRSILMGASTCLACLILFSAANAATPEVTVINPSEGTIGTVFTISGADFGTSRGLVFIGNSLCKTLSWGDTSIMAQVLLPMPPGKYSVVVRYPGGFYSRLIIPDAFTIMPPELDPPEFRPQFVVPGDVVTLDGKFFGQGYRIPHLEIENLRGDRIACRVLDWTMDTITFELPDGIPGIFALRIRNAVGADTEPWWGTFEEAPNKPPYVVGTITGMTTHDNATAVSYLNKLWAFYPHINDQYNTIAYRIYDGVDFSDGHYLETVDGVRLESKAQITPVVANDILYAFYTGKDGNLYYTIYDFVQTEMKRDEAERDGEDPEYVDDIWLSEQKIPDASVADISGKFAVAYNFTKKVIEIYWTPDSTSVKMKTFNVETKAWSPNKTVTLPIPGSYIAPYLTAVFNQFAEDDDEIFDYVTYLSWGDGDGGYLAELKDGEIIRDGEKPRYVYSADWKSVNTKRGPSLADLTYDYLAVIVNKTHTRSYYQKYYKDSHTPDPSGLMKVPYESPQDEVWAPTGVAYSKKVADADSPSGFRMDTNFYAFVANNSVAKDTRWQFVNCEALGYWMPNSLTGTDIDLNDTDESEGSFELWPLLGIVDMPPYVENGHECELGEWDKCGTYVELGWEKSTEEGLSVDFSIGPYYRTRARNPAEAEVGAGYALSFEDSTKKTYSHTDTLEMTHEGYIIAYYFVPKFTVFQLDWYDFDGGKTDFFTQSMQISGAEFHKKAFTPYDGPLESNIAKPYLDREVFPYHDADNDFERLASYLIGDPIAYGYKSPFKSQDCEWYPVSGCDFGFKITEDRKVDQGFYVNFKLGGKFPGGVVGVEGDLKVMFTSRAETNVEAHTWFKGSEKKEGDGPFVDYFKVYGYWLKGDNSGYWVPEYRRPYGDEPWFVTYRISNYLPFIVPEP